MNLLRILFVGILAAGLVPVSSIAAENPEQMIEAAKTLDAAFLKAFNAGDVEAFAVTYWHSPDVVSFPPDAMERRGWDAIHAAASEMFKGMPGARIEMPETH